ncbi:Putative thioesterase [Rhodobacterales bacterium HTCC2150]|nr:Putative thioesterase [Rhodobacterales bacterium HTCC2150] [Rhodobacteraceae bacterium HTCC2150]
MAHSWPIRIYYEDTDMAGIVYYANYLKFIERGRSEMLRDLGVDQAALRDNDGIVFAVRRVEAYYLMAAKFDDQLDVVTKVTRVSGARVVLNQQVFRNKDVVFQAIVTIVALSTAGSAARLPQSVREVFNNASA